MINDIANPIFGPTGLSLRADGVLFLALNIGHLIVIPWQETEQRDFRTTHGPLLADDIRDIFL
jgi:hypothetical protein